MPPKKKTEDTPAPDEVNAAEAAAAEVLDTGPVVIPFRGQKFETPRDVLTSARFLLALASGQDHRIMAELIAQTDFDRFMALLQRGEQLPVVAMEYLTAVRTAAGWGNFKPS